MRKYAKELVATVLGWQVRRLYKKHNFQVIAVAGSIGKTSTKLAVAKVLGQKFRVQFQDGNYNDIVSVPLIFFGQTMPSLFNPFAWLDIFWKNERVIGEPYPYDIVVVEVGTDGPGQIEQFKKYLKADICVLTAIAPEHMMFFNGLDGVAEEELKITELSALTIINTDSTDGKYLKNISTAVISYGLKNRADFMIKKVRFDNQGCDFEIVQVGKTFLQAKHELISEPQLYSVLAASVVAQQLGMDPKEIEVGIRNIKPVPGRMQKLNGLKGSTIIDDSYNASPRAAIAALDTLYRIKAPYKIAVLGNMNELGRYSEELHRQVGEHCDPKQLDLVVTIGPDANKYLAEAAAEKGCLVKTFNNPYATGEYLKQRLKKDSLILVKGSQNRVFAEETVKILLSNPDDAERLVRQTDYWLSQKKKAFKL